jgi:hypothetical protein
MSIFDADMCFIEDFDIEKELNNYDIIAPKRIQWMYNIQMVPEAPIFDYIWVHCCFFNLKTIINITSINLFAISNTTCDTGSMIVEFFYNNPQYKIKYLNFSAGSERINDLFNFEFFWNFKVLHFTSGSVWDNHQYNTHSVPYSYQEKMKKMYTIVEHGLSDSDRIIVDNAYNTKWYEFHKKFTGTYATKQDLINYGLKIL